MSSKLKAYYVKGTIPPSSGKPKRKRIKLEYPFTIEIENEEGDIMIVQICNIKKSCITVTGVSMRVPVQVLSIQPRHSTFLEIGMADMYDYNT